MYLKFEILMGQVVNENKLFLTRFIESRSIAVGETAHRELHQQSLTQFIRAQIEIRVTNCNHKVVD